MAWAAAFGGLEGGERRLQVYAAGVLLVPPVVEGEPFTGSAALGVGAPAPAPP